MTPDEIEKEHGPHRRGTARKHAQEHSAYRLELRKGRTLAVKLCNKLIQDAIDGNAISRQHLEALAEIMKDAREMLGGKNGKRSQGKRHDKDAIVEAMRAMED